MSKLSRWLSLALLPLAGAFDSASYYAARSVLYRHLLEDGGASYEDVGVAMTGASFASLLGTVLAGVVAAATGPWILACAGAGFLLLATAMLGGLPPEVGILGAVFLGFAHGMTRTALFGAAARAFPDFRTESLRNAACFGIYGAANFAALLTPEIASRIAEETGSSAVFFSAAVLGALPLLAILIGLGVVVWMTRDKPDELSDPPERAGQTHLVVVAVVLITGGLVWALWSSGFDVLVDLARGADGGYQEHEGLMRLNPLLVTVGCFVAFLVSVGLHFATVRVPTLVPVGLGMLLISASLVALLSADSADDAVVTPAVVLLSVGELLAAPLLLSRLMGDLSKRLPTLAVALFYVLSTGPMLMLRLVSDDLDISRGMAGLGAAAAGFVGLGFAVMGLVLFRKLFPDPELPKEF